jgi:Protein of unknown function (DUF2490)
MVRMHATLRLIGLALIVWLGGATGAAGQDGTTKEIWPEIDAWLRLSPAWRLSMFVPISKNLETYYREGSLVLQADYAFGSMKNPQKRRMVDDSRALEMKRFLFRGGYLGGQSLDDRGEAYKERSALFELHVRTPLKGRFLMSGRLRSDLRWLGDNHEFSARLRYRLMFEKEFLVRRASIVPYASVEPYYDTRYKTVNRVRLVGGATLAIWSRFALETNITYQYDSKSSVTNLWALNVILHVFFDTARAREPS